MIAARRPLRAKARRAFGASKRFAIGKTLPEGGLIPPEDVETAGVSAEQGSVGVPRAAWSA